LTDINTVVNQCLTILRQDPDIAPAQPGKERTLR
jgi:hypothetical protein